MLGAVIGDIVGSVYEAHPVDRWDFPFFHRAATFTDDTVLTVAVADAILHRMPYSDALRKWARRYPTAGYGGSFFSWFQTDGAGPYGSWGNGSAMRVSPVGLAFESEAVVLEEAAASARPTHDHPEGVKGAQAVALAVFMAKTGSDREEIRIAIAKRFGYDLDRTLTDIRPGYGFDVSCQGSVPESIIAFLESSDVESAVRNAVYLGGDADTMACIAGAVAAAYYGGVPEWMAREARARLPDDLRGVIDAFLSKAAR